MSIEFSQLLRVIAQIETFDVPGNLDARRASLLRLTVELIIDAFPVLVTEAFLCERPAAKAADPAPTLAHVRYAAAFRTKSGVQIDAFDTKTKLERFVRSKLGLARAHVDRYLQHHDAEDNEAFAQAAHDELEVREADRVDRASEININKYLHRLHGPRSSITALASTRAGSALCYNDLRGDFLSKSVDDRPNLIKLLAYEAVHKNELVHSGGKLQSMLVIPVHTTDGALLGLLRLMNKTDGGFSEADAQIVSVIGRSLAPHLLAMSPRSGPFISRAGTRRTCTIRDFPEPVITFHGTVMVHGRKERVEVIGDSEAARALNAIISKVGPEDGCVLITGESGTGKSVVAKALHARSHRATGPYVDISMPEGSESLKESELFGHMRGAFTGAVRDKAGKLQDAHQGTAFLDEIGEVPMTIQPKLLKFLEQHRITTVGSNTEKPVDVRIICATNRDLDRAVAEKSFREDLYYRIKVHRISLKPLRERGRDEILMFARYFLESLAAKTGKVIRAVDEVLFRYLQTAEFRGNARQLHNDLEACIAFTTPDGVVPGEPIVADLPARVLTSTRSQPITFPLDVPLPQFVERFADQLVERARAQARTQAEAARLLGVTSAALWGRKKRKPTMTPAQVDKPRITRRQRDRGSPPPPAMHQSQDPL